MKMMALLSTEIIKINKKYMIELFKTDTKDKLRVLKIYTEGAELIQESGLVDGAKVSHRKTCVGKNIGRSNETTPEAQAISEMNSKATDKRTEGYFTFERLEELAKQQGII